MEKGHPSVSTLSPFEVTVYLQGISPVPLPILEQRRVHYWTAEKQALQKQHIALLSRLSQRGTVIALLKTLNNKNIYIGVDMSLLTCHYCVDMLLLPLFLSQRKICSNERGTFLYQRCTSHACSGDIAQIKIHNQITYAAFLCRWIIKVMTFKEKCVCAPLIRELEWLQIPICIS